MNAETKINTEAEAKEDLYYMVHKGVRLANVRMLTALGQADAGDDASIDAVLQQLYGHLEMSRSHLDHENREVHSAIEARCPGGSDHAADDHDDHLESFSELRRLAEDVASATVDRPAKLRRLYQRFALFVADDFQHMHEEETVLQPLLEANFTNAELLDINQRIVSDIPPAKMAQFLRFMLGGASRSERIGMLTGMQMGMPAEVFSGIMHTVVGSPWQMGDWDGLERAVC
ncbi:MAG: hypothetical protein CL535_02005 [Ahrensia sp.]|nr:hypothetical protein [Ahrensia sp.]|tara:strand:+ start:21737 stop:22429 length:693 start_codon:yes stop_codon:yes gene_type:complete